MPDAARPLVEDYRAFQSGFGYYVASPRTWIEITGSDCAQVVHNLCTNDILRLEPGQGCEAFVTNLQGKTIGHVFVFRHHQRIDLLTVPGQADQLVQHFDRYIIREDAHLRDQSAGVSSILMGGVDAERWLATITDSPPHATLGHSETHVDGVAVQAIRFAGGGPNGYLLKIDSGQRGGMIERLNRSGARSCDAECVETLRLEGGIPEFGKEITEQNLPQEINRDAQCISFTKGCYLGQETVARIDALGHVNRLLVGLHCQTDDIPTVGSSVRDSGQEVGKITSSCYSMILQAPLAFATVRRGHHETGSELATDEGPACVTMLPLPATF